MRFCGLYIFLGVCAVVGASACADDGDATTPDGGNGADSGGDEATSGHATVADKFDPTVPKDALKGTVDDVEPLPDDVALPIVFVHGFAGSAQQIQSQAMRYEANGYPQGLIKAYDHHGGLVGDDFVGGLDEVVDATLEELKVDQVYLIGHSRGTSVSAEYLSVQERADKVAKYISLDGRGCDAAEAAGVPCIAPDQRSLPGQAHVEVAISEESFVAQYEFLVGETPAVVHIVPQRDPVVISGRAVLFPDNVGRAGSTLEIWPLKTKTGKRATEAPVVTYEIDKKGDFGPLRVDPDTFYELVLSADDRYHHFYPQRFIRSTPFVRLLSGDAESDTAKNTHTGDTHAAVIAMRMREWKTSDVLRIRTTSASGGDQKPVNAMTDEVGIESGGFGSIGIHIHDDEATPGESSRELLPYFASQSFQTGVDVFMPASEPPDGTITFTNLPLGDAKHPQVIRMPNWASSTHRITVMFADYAQD